MTKYRNPYKHRENRKKYIQYFSRVIRKKQREDRKKKHRCVDCNDKIKPKIYYSYRCDYCQGHQRRNAEKYKMEKESANNKR